MQAAVKKRLFNREEYHLMGEMGILKEKHIELINGEIVNMSPIGSKHSSHVKKITALLYRYLINKAIVSVQDPIVISKYSEPEPDLAILKPRKDFYSEIHPTASDVILIIEVAQSSLDYDREVKLSLYASAAIPEVWIVNLQDYVLEIYSQPKENAYSKKVVKKPGDEVHINPLDISFNTSDLFITEVE